MEGKDQEQERTEEATPRRREEAREKGQVARSQELVSVVILVACLIYFYFGASGLIKNVTDLMAYGFRTINQTELTPENLNYIFGSYFSKGIIIVIPLMLTVVVAAIVASIVQVGILFSSEPLMPKISKIDPIKGFQRLFSFRSIVELVKGIIKICIVTAIAYFVIRGETENIISLMEETTWGVLIFFGRICFKIILSSTAVLVVLAILDYIYQRWEYDKSLRMTRQEIKDEFKNTEGDPLIKSRIKRIQRDIARKRMMAQVPKADVVITNPTHLAVAIQYSPDLMSAPKVVAKGANLIAEKIRQIAEENDVPVLEDKPLAQVLYKMVSVGNFIPEELYRAVAEVLAFVYRQKNKVFG